MTLDSLIERDDGVCVWCGRAPWRSDLSAEHLLPRARQGHGIPENLAVACRRCNKRRRTRSVAAYVRDLLGAGERPRLDLLTGALERLSQSGSRRHVDYARRELDLLSRVG